MEKWLQFRKESVILVCFCDVSEFMVVKLHKNDNRGSTVGVFALGYRLQLVLNWLNQTSFFYSCVLMSLAVHRWSVQNVPKSSLFSLFVLSCFFVISIAILNIEYINVYVKSVFDATQWCVLTELTILQL